MNDDEDNFNEQAMDSSRKEDFNHIMKIKQVKEDLTSLKKKVLRLLNSIIDTINEQKDCLQGTWITISCFNLSK